MSVDLFASARRSDDFCDIDDVALKSSIERYARFLWLCSRYPDRPLAPSRDIDRIWHLHMLNPRAYARDCQVLLGDLLDHDGGFGSTDEEAPILAHLFSETARLWAMEFGEPYTGVPSSGIVKCTRNCQSRCQRKCST